MMSWFACSSGLVGLSCCGQLTRSQPLLPQHPLVRGVLVARVIAPLAGAHSFVVRASHGVLSLPPFGRLQPKGASWLTCDIALLALERLPGGFAPSDGMAQSTAWPQCQQCP